MIKFSLCHIYIKFSLITISFFLCVKDQALTLCNKHSRGDSDETGMFERFNTGRAPFVSSWGNHSWQVIDREHCNVVLHGLVARVSLGERRFRSHPPKPVFYFGLRAKRRGNCEDELLVAR